jgi:acetylornithine deacetylase
METFNSEHYVQLLSSMIAHTEKLQNNPPVLIPQESLIADIVVRELESCKNIKIKRCEYTQGRPNLVIKYENFVDEIPKKSLGFVGSHMDVVPIGNPSEWKVDPFKLTIDEKDPDILYGRGTTDCLGHVALLTLLLKYLSENDIKLDYVLGIIFIADEENGDDETIGIKHLMQDGELDFLKYGPVYWLDSSDIYPTVGSGTGMAWDLCVKGKKGHSGMPNNTINPMIFAIDATLGMLEVFKKNFPAHDKEKDYKYPCSSNMKPTQWKGTGGSINQICNECTVQGDVRLTPFYDWKDVQKVLNEYIDDLNQNPEKFPSYHESFPFKLNDEEKVKLELKWPREPYLGIACDMESVGFKLISDATKKIHGSMDVQSCCGSLPLIADLQHAGFDMQICGYGHGESYHANNEYCRLSGMKKGYEILLNIVASY